MSHQTNPSHIRMRYLLVDFTRKIRSVQSVEEQDRLIAEYEEKLLVVARDSEQWIDEKELVKRYPAFFSTVNVARNLRQRGGGPVFVKRDEHRQSPVRYKIADVERWIVELEEHTKHLDLSISGKHRGDVT